MVLFAIADAVALPVRDTRGDCVFFVMKPEENRF